MRLQEQWSALVASVPRAITVLLSKAQPLQTGSSTSLKLWGGGRQLKANFDIWKLVSHPVSLLLACLFGSRAGWGKCFSDHRRLGSKLADLQLKHVSALPSIKIFH